MSRGAMAILLALWAACAVAAPARAETADWSVEVGGAARVRPTHLGANRYVVDSVPVVEATYGDRLSLSFDDGLKWRALRVGQVSLGPIAEYRQSFNDRLPSRAFRMRDTVELGGFAEWRTPLGVAEARLRRAVNGYQGWSGELSFNTGAPVTSRLSLAGQARLAWADAAFTQEYFGLQPHAAQRFGLPRFLDEDFTTAGAEIDAAQALTPRARLILALTADRIVGELRPSPLFQNRDILTASLGLTYRWGAGPSGRNP